MVSRRPKSAAEDMAEDVWNTPTDQGVTVNQPAETPSELVAPAAEPVVETPVESKTEGAEEKASTEAAPEQVKDEATSGTDGDQSPAESDVKRESRRVFFKVKDELGGEAFVDEAVTVARTLQSSDADAKAKVQALYQLAPRAFEEVQREVFFSHWDKPGQKDALFADEFGEGVTREKIAEALKYSGHIAPSPAPTTTKAIPTVEELGKMSDDEVVQKFRELQNTLPPEIQAKLDKLDRLESQVSEFSQAQAQSQQEKAQALGREFVAEMMAPAERLMKEAGLEVLPDDTPEEKAWKEEISNTIRMKTHIQLTQSDENKPLADDIEMFLTKLDRAAAWSKLKTAQARAEMVAAKLIPIYTSHRQQQRDAQTSVLTKDRPPMVPGGQASFGTPQPLPVGRDVWNDRSESERWKDIAQSVA